MTTKSGSGPSSARLCAAAIFSCLSLARRLALPLPTALDDTGGEGFTVGCCPLVACGPAVHSYSPKCVEGKFSEVHIQDRECPGPNAPENPLAGALYRTGPMHLVTPMDRYPGLWIASGPDDRCEST